MISSCTNSSRRFRVTFVAAVLAIGWGCGPEPTAPDVPATRPAGALSFTAAASFQAISSNNFKSCGVTSDARIFCWPGSTQTHGEFVSSTLHFRQVSVGGDHVCAVTEADLAYCWGAN